VGREKQKGKAKSVLCIVYGVRSGMLVGGI
jgi:hypothetical protein